MHVIEWVAKTVNRDGKNLRHLKSQKINLFQSFLYCLAFNLVFICPTLCHLKITCLLLMKQKLYALDAFFIEKLKLSENDPQEGRTKSFSRHPRAFGNIRICPGVYFMHVTKFFAIVGVLKVFRSYLAHLLFPTVLQIPLVV